MMSRNEITARKEIMKLKLPKKLAMLLLGIWLIVTGLLQITSISIPGINTILAIVAIAAGLLIMLGR